MNRVLSIPGNESCGMLFSATRAYCLDEEELVWLGDASGKIELPDAPHVGLIFNDNKVCRRALLGELDLSLIQLVYFHNPFILATDDWNEDLSGLIMRANINAPDDEECELLANLPGLRAVNLAEAEISNAGFRMLCEIQSLESLSVACTEITDEAIANITLLSGLRELDLSFTPISDDILPIIGKLTALEELRLASTGISEEGIQNLRDLKSLKFLDVSDTATTDDGARCLAAFLGDCQIFL